jgi:hypothetical protein
VSQFEATGTKSLRVDSSLRARNDTNRNDFVVILSRRRRINAERFFRSDALPGRLLVKVMFPASSLAILLAGSILIQPAVHLEAARLTFYKSPGQCEAAPEKLRRLDEAGRRYPALKRPPGTEPYCTDKPGFPREPPAEPAQSPGASRSH